MYTLTSSTIHKLQITDGLVLPCREYKYIPSLVFRKLFELSLFMDIKLVMHMHTAPNENFP